MNVRRRTRPNPIQSAQRRGQREKPIDTDMFEEYKKAARRRVGESANY
jgi:hypothetical protein